jgi:hypothetical protein
MFENTCCVLSWRNVFDSGSHNTFWVFQGRNHSEDRGIDGSIILERVVKVWTAGIWLRIGSSDRLLWTR